MSLADTFFDASLRVDTILWLAAIGDQPCEAFRDFVERSDNKHTTALVTQLLGITAKRWDKLAQEEQHEEIASLFARRRLEGFLVHVATPVPTDFTENGGIITYGYGFTTGRWFYTETLDAAFAAVVVKWKNEYYAEEKKKHAAKAKKGEA